MQFAKCAFAEYEPDCICTAGLYRHLNWERQLQSRNSCAYDQWSEALISSGQWKLALPRQNQRTRSTDHMHTSLAIRSPSSWMSEMRYSSRTQVGGTFRSSLRCSLPTRLHTALATWTRSHIASVSNASSLNAILSVCNSRCELRKLCLDLPFICVSYILRSKPTPKST